jgi:hypothetical protein
MLLVEVHELALGPGDRGQYWCHAVKGASL